MVTSIVYSVWFSQWPPKVINEKKINVNEQKKTFLTMSRRYNKFVLLDCYPYSVLWIHYCPILDSVYVYLTKRRSLDVLKACKCLSPVTEIHMFVVCNSWFSISIHFLSTCFIQWFIRRFIMSTIENCRGIFSLFLSE